MDLSDNDFSFSSLTGILRESFIPLKYDPTIDFTVIKNIVLIDSEVQDYPSFVQNCNSSTFPIVYSYNSDR